MMGEDGAWKQGEPNSIALDIRAMRGRHVSQIARVYNPHTGHPIPKVTGVSVNIELDTRAHVPSRASIQFVIEDTPGTTYNVKVHDLGNFVFLYNPLDAVNDSHVLLVPHTALGRAAGS